MQALLGPFTSGEAYAAGITPRMLRGPRYRRLFVGVHLAASVEVTEGVRVAAALKVLPPGTLVTGVTALRSWGVDVGSAAPLHFATVHPHPVRRPGLVVSRTSMLPPDRGSVVIPEHAFVSAAPHLNLLELVSAGDRLVRLERCASLTSPRTPAATPVREPRTLGGRRLWFGNGWTRSGRRDCAWP